MSCLTPKQDVFNGDLFHSIFMFNIMPCLRLILLVCGCCAYRTVYLYHIVPQTLALHLVEMLSHHSCTVVYSIYIVITCFLRSLYHRRIVLIYGVLTFSLSLGIDKEDEHYDRACRNARQALEKFRFMKCHFGKAFKGFRRESGFLSAVSFLLIH